jgi:hypothetical protein
MSSGVKALIAVLALIVVGILAAFVLAATDDSGHVKNDPSVAAAKQAVKEQRLNTLEAERARLKREARAKQRRAEANAEQPQPASAGTNGTEGQRAVTKSSGTSGAKLSSSFSQLESEIAGEIGVAYALGPGEVQQLGPLEVGHAWSSFKVPIVVTLMLKQNGSLTSEQQSLAASAITASDNDAAAALFSAIESKTGGAASAAVEEVLSTSGGATEVATAPPPPGAVSSWGQTEWPLAGSTQFYAALACDAYGPSAKALAVGDMENVISEQQWGLGQADFPSGTRIAFKAGWGPEASESGPYLVRQAGIIRSPEGQLVVTIAAQDSTGSFDAGVADLNRIADWVAEELPLNSSC